MQLLSQVRAGTQAQESSAQSALPSHASPVHFVRGGSFCA